MLGAAVFTPQAAAAIGHMSAPARARPRDHVHLPGLVARVGAGHADRRLAGRDLRLALAFGAVPRSRSSARAGCVAVMPDGVKPAALSLQGLAQGLHAPGADGHRGWSRRCRQRRAVHAVLVFRAVLQPCFDASPAQIGGLFAWFGAFGLIGNVLLARHIDRIGAGRCGARDDGPDHAVAAAVAAGGGAAGRGAGAGALGAGLLLDQLRRSRRAWDWPRPRSRRR